MKKIDFKASVMLNPVPAVMISSRNKDGKDNIFTVSWVNTVCTRPPMLSISIRPERLSHDYITESMEFIVNVPSSKLTYETDFCGVKSGKKVDKIKELNLKMIEGEHVSAAYIDECPVAIECRVKQIIKLGSHDLFIADVLGSHIDENMLDEKGKIHFELGDLINYAHGEYYPMAKEAIGKFGYSTKITKEENTKNKEEALTKTTITTLVKEEENKITKEKSKPRRRTLTKTDISKAKSFNKSKKTSSKKSKSKA